MFLQAPPAEARPAPTVTLRAQYDWGYVGADGEGKGVLSMLLRSSDQRLVLEVHGVGERLVFLEGSASEGYRLQIPRRKVDRREAGLQSLQIPYLPPQLGSVEALARLVEKGEAPGVKVMTSDALGPRKLKYQGKDEDGNDVMVWLTRKKLERE
ncbi:MAG: hypothetical protein HY823_05955 [Acidobacteria bacterium]|nr:hypothetical protein [Acidobacteriota bacterium]